MKRFGPGDEASEPRFDLLERDEATAPRFDLTGRLTYEQQARLLLRAIGGPVVTRRSAIGGFTHTVGESSTAQED